MFVITTIVDTIRIPPPLLSLNTVDAIHSEIDKTYPNRIVMNVGLVVARYGRCLEVGHGTCVAGNSGPHFECKFRLIVFRPFIGEVCLGRILKSTTEGIHVSCGFFREIFVPSKQMLLPSHYEEKSGLWVWTPDYGDEKEEEEGQESNNGTNGDGASESKETSNGDAEEEEEDSRFEMDIGAMIRFKVKSINFTQITNTAKGLQATTTTTGLAPSSKTRKRSDDLDVSNCDTVRRRSSSVSLDETKALPPGMQIIASICEDGLGLTSWWEAPADEDEDEQQTNDHRPDSRVKEEPDNHR